MYNFVKSAIERHLDETKPLIEQLTDEIIMKKPIDEVREIGEVILHLIRSAEYYLQGLVINKWEVLDYNLDAYYSPEKIDNLYQSVSLRVISYLDQLDDNTMGDNIEGFNRIATKAEILAEMLEHSLHHRGQLTLYYRLLGIKPAEIAYII